MVWLTCSKTRAVCDVSKEYTKRHTNVWHFRNTECQNSFGGKMYKSELSSDKLQNVFVNREN